MRGGSIPVDPNPAARKTSATRAWRDAVLVYLLNPKVAIFIFAFRPQFVDPERGSALLQFLVLGAILIAGGTLITALAGVFSGTIGLALATNQRAAKLFHRLTGVLFLGLAANLVLSRR